ncbi:hypothetical protein BP6252_01799 [Coleophoma cylindrospora]|uniref:Uncharacterized protein n=1 Tax=Coleophoma cylindrospora TaxID=1849047 RepID=A0A3D8STY6_9HELO|nr:hypothetical protein BP6252_01799 [Coleophoma cylindrospora]
MLSQLFFLSVLGFLAGVQGDTSAASGVSIIPDPRYATVGHGQVMSVLWGFTEGLDSLFGATSIGSNADTTTWELVPTVLQTVSNTPIPEPGLTQTYTIGPTTEILNYHETFEGMAYTQSQACSKGGTTTLVCTVSAGGADVDTANIVTDTYTASDISYALFNVVALVTTSATETSSRLSIISTATTRSSAPTNLATSSAAVVGATASDTTRGTATTQGSTSIGTTGNVHVASSTSAGGQARITSPPKWIVYAAAAAIAEAVLEMG